MWNGWIDRWNSCQRDCKAQQDGWRHFKSEKTHTSHADEWLNDDGAVRDLCVCVCVLVAVRKF